MAFTNNKLVEQPLYVTWKNMRQRCQNPNSPSYKNYGGRGIWIHPDWNEYKQFHLDMGDRPEGKTLDRIDNDGPYCKENCRWADRKTQNRNSRKCKLTDTEVLAIRSESRKGPGGIGGTGSGYTLIQLAKKYNTSYRNIRAIVDNQNWKE